MEVVRFEIVRLYCSDVFLPWNAVLRKRLKKSYLQSAEFDGIIEARSEKSLQIPIDYFFIDC